MTEAIILDFFGTVARPTLWPRTPAAVLRARGYEVGEAARNRWRDEASYGVDHVSFSVDRDRYTTWEMDRLAELARDSGVPDAEIPSVLDEMYSVRRPAAMELFPETREVVGRLRKMGLFVVLCSNWDWDLDRLVSDLEADGLFDLVVSSAWAGARKPNPRIYRYLLERVGCRADQVLSVGDTLTADVIGPIDAGMRAVWLDRADPVQWDGAGATPSRGEMPEGTVRIQDLTELIALVSRGAAETRPPTRPRTS